ncbi:uncharacterized protein LOC144101674 [Amblyomma americanum]
MHGTAYSKPAGSIRPHGFNQATNLPLYAQSMYPPPECPPPPYPPPASGQATLRPLLIEQAGMHSLLLGSADPKMHSENSASTFMTILCALLFFLISASVVTVLWLGGAFANPVTETKDESDVSVRIPLGPSPPMVVEVPERGDDPGPVTLESSTTTVGVETTTPLRPNVPGHETLLCTYGKGTTADSVMAEDGLCDYAFFDSLYQSDENTVVDHKRFGQDLRTFLRAADRYTRTALGLAFAFYDMVRASSDVRKANPSPMEQFWRKRIFHVGVLDTPETVLGRQMLASITLLKMLHNLASERGHSSLTVLAAPTPHKDWATFLVLHGRNLGYYPDMFVVHGHYTFGDNVAGSCAVMPPTRYSAVKLPDEFLQEYQFDLESAPSSIRELQDTNVSSRGLVSVTMKGRWTSPSAGETFEFYSRCDTNPNAVSFGSYTEVCTNSNYTTQLQYKPDHYAMLTHHATRRRAFAYDNEEGLCTKLCKVKGKVADMIFGIAAYDVDFDDYANKCSSLNKFGSHSRLKTLRRIIEYYKSLARDNFHEKSCTSIVR